MISQITLILVAIISENSYYVIRAQVFKVIFYIKIIKAIDGFLRFI